MSAGSACQRIKGTVDLLPEDTRAWRALAQAVTDEMALTGYEEIRTPLLEPTELFVRGVGEETDIVTKEMFTFERADRSMTLRPEGTAGVVRAYLENGMHRRPSPQRLYYMGPMFRYERPQAGRQRQFHQIGAELFGAKGAPADAECILLAWRVLQRAGVPAEALSLQVNSVGSGESRARFVNGLKDLVRPHLDKLDEVHQQRYEKNPLRLLDSKDPYCVELFASAAFEQFLNDSIALNDAWDQCEKTIDLLKAMGVPVSINRRLVRGLDYYTGVVFEVSSNLLGAQSAVCGGGRYDNLVASLGGPDTPATGFGIGVERLMLLQQASIAPPPCVYIVTDQYHADAFQLAATLRAEGIPCQVDLSGRAFGKQLASAEKAGAVLAVIRGEEEARHGGWVVKDLAAKTQSVLETPCTAAVVDMYRQRVETSGS